MSWTLFKATLRANWILGLVFAGILLIYAPTAVGMFNPDSAAEIEAMLSLLPEPIWKAMGFVDLGTDLTVYLANYLYGFVMIAFPMIYCSILANRLIARHVDRGSMAYLLATPNTRVRIGVTQALYLVVSLAVVLGINVAVTLVMAEGMFPGRLDVSAFLALNWLTYLALLAAGAAGFVSSCSFSETRYSLAVGAGVPGLFFVLRMLSGLGEETEWLGYLSVYSVISIDRILTAPSYALNATLVLLPATALLLAAGVLIFDRRSLAV